MMGRKVGENFLRRELTMRIVLLMFTTTLAFLPAARAESFMCGGVGAFASIHSAVVNFGAGGADKQVLLETN